MSPGRAVGVETGLIQIGVDFGGTKIEGLALAGDGSDLARRRIPTPRAYEPAIAAVVSLVEALEQAAGERGTVGIGAPGSISPRSGLMRNANSTWLNGRRFREDLETALGRPVRLANDANCCLLYTSRCV